jgi:uncharacterized protein (TIGR02001 family)
MKSKFVALTSLALAAAATLPGTVSRADEPAWGPFTANIALTNDYRFRGQQQSQGDPAVSGGIDYAGSSGFFAGVWASNVDFNDAAETYMELDLYAGFTGALSDKTTGTIKAVYYLYPTADYPPSTNEYDYFELIGSLAHDFGGGTGTLELAWSPDYFAKSGSAVALTGGVSVPLAESVWFFDGGISASGKFGYQWIDENVTFGTPDYAFYDIGLSAKVANVTLDVRWVDTDLDEVDCFGGTNLCEGGVVATLTLLLPG